MNMLYFGILNVGNEWIVVEINPTTINPFRCKLVREWEVFSTKIQAQNWLFETLSRMSKWDSSDEIDIHIFSKSILLKELV